MKLIKKIVFQHSVLWKIYRRIKKRNGKLGITNNGAIRIKKEISGNNNQLIIGNDTLLDDVTIHMIGNNNKIIFGDRCIVGAGCSFWTEGNNITIVIGNDCTFTKNVHINAQEDDVKIEIGNDCMFSNTIIIRTSDSHPIYDKESNIRTNYAKSIKIGNHVWVAPNSKIMKGATIEDGCIIGSDTMVTKNVPANSLVVGYPAHVVKSNIRWTREDVIFNHI